MCLFYSMFPVKNTFMYLAIMCQPVEDGSYKASVILECSLLGTPALGH